MKPVSPERTLLLVVDLINDLVHEEGPNGSTALGQQIRERRVIENAAMALQHARSTGMRVGYVRVGFSPDYRECPPTSPIFGPAMKNGLFKLGTWGTEVHEAVAPIEHEFDIVKHRISPFHGTTLGLIIRQCRVEKLLVIGVSTNAAIQSTIREAHDRDLETVLLEDCCSSHSAEDHDLALTSMSRLTTVSTAAAL